MIYQEEPKGFVADLEVVGCFVEAKGNILQLLRPDNNKKAEPRKWGCVGGKIEEGEGPRTAMVREMREETSLNIFPSQLYFCKKFYVEYPACKFIYHIFKLKLPFRPEINLSMEHISYVWIPPAYANSLDLMQDEWECIKLVYGL